MSNADCHPWEFTEHAILRMREMNLSADEVLEVLDYPEITYPAPRCHRSGRTIAVGGRLAVVFDTTGRFVLTVLWHLLDSRWVQPDAWKEAA